MPEPKIKLTLTEFNKINKALSKKLTLGIGKLSLDPKLQAKMNTSLKSFDKTVEKLCKKHDQGDTLDLVKLKPDYCKAQNDLLLSFEKLQKNHYKKNPDPSFDIQKNKANWGKLKLKAGPLEFYIKPTLKGTDIKLKEAGVGVKLF